MGFSNQFLFTLAIVAVVLPTVALTTEFMVGDGPGWTVGFDYAAWAKDKEFYVGDKLVFTYPVGKHNIFKVNGTTFNDCAIPPSNDALSTRNGVISLATRGRKWYFCGVDAHCKGWQKLAITIWPAMVAPAPAPNSEPLTTTIPPSNDALSTRNGVITLATPGRNWYFCGVAAHCKGGQKLVITVCPTMVAPAPAPNSAIGITSSRISVLFTIMISLAHRLMEF